MKISEASRTIYNQIARLAFLMVGEAVAAALC